MSVADTRSLCQRAPVIPVLIVEEAAQAVPLGRALVAGGLPVLEVTLRTPAAVEAIRRMAAEVEGAVVGAGTARTAADVAAVARAGAQFVVSPGLTDPVREACCAHGLPLLPGVATPTEAMRAADQGLEVLKFFPAEANGGVGVLNAWASPLAGLSFCPTGGITLATAPAYLALDGVLCVGGSWVAPKALVDAGAWDHITALAREAAGLG